MIKKISATAAVIVLAATALTGCSSKLSAADTCAYINDQAKEQGLAEQIKSSQASVMTGDFAKLAEPMGSLVSILSDAADKTDDDKLAEALNATADQSQKMVDLLKEKDMNIMSLSEKMNELTDAEGMEEYGDYLENTCPDMDALDSL